MLLFLLLLLITALGLLGGLGLLSAYTTRTTATERRGQRKVDVLLGVETDDEGRHIDNLFSNTDMALANQNACVVDRLGKPKLVNTSLQAALQEILNLERKHVIQLHARLIEDTDADETTDEGISLEKTLRILLIEGKKLTASLLASAK